MTICYNNHSLGEETVTEMWSKIKRWLPRGLCLLAAVYLYMRVIGCPIRLLTGISCAGCGMTRAWWAALRLDFRAAFYYHPLFPLPAAAVLLYLCRKKIPRAAYRGCLYAGAFLFAAVYLYRMLEGDGSVVAFAPQQGLLFQIGSYIIRRIPS